MSKAAGKSTENKIKRLEQQYFRYAEGSKERKNIEQRIQTLKNG